MRQAAIPAPAGTHAAPIEDAEGARKFFLQQRLPAGMTELPVNRYVAAREHIAGMPRIPIASSAPRAGLRAEAVATETGWTSVGPGNVGGRTRALLINPQNPSIMYAGAVTGGVWKTTNAGQSWTPLFDSQAVLNIGALLMDPTDPNTIYAGTGEWYTAFQGDGIYKTTDGGVTWVLLPATANSQFYYVNELVVSPTNNLRLYAATWSGVWTSPNGGNTWTNILSTKIAYYGCQGLAIRPDTPTDIVFASCSGATAAGDYQILQNTTAPSTAWVQVQTQPTQGRTSLAIAPSQPTTIYAMSTVNDSTSPLYHALLAVYVSTSGGGAGTWTTQVTNTDPNPINTLLLTDSRTATDPPGSTTNYCSGTGPVVPATGQGNYDNLLAVDPTNPNVVWAGGIDLFRSDNGGTTWGVASLWQVPYGNPQFAHADRHVIQFHPNYNGTTNQTMYLGNDGGLFRTDNALGAVATGPLAVCIATFESTSAVRWIDLNSSFVATQFYHGFAYPGGLAYMGGAQDNSVSRGTDLGSLNAWTIFSTGDGTAVSIDPFDANHVLKSTQNLSLDRAIDGGTFLSSVTGITESSASFPFVPALAGDPNDGNRLFLGGTTNLWRSLDGAATWTAAAPVEAKSQVTAIAVSPADSNTVLFGTELGFIYRTTAALSSNSATQWSSSQPRNAFVSGLAYDPTDPQIVYATYSTLKSAPSDAHIYKSFDGGVTWAASDGSGPGELPDTPVFRLLVNPYNPSTLYVGSDLGVFVSTDAGGTWGHDPNEFSNVIVEELAFDQVANPNWLFAFTYGRGAFRAPLPGSASPSCNFSVIPTTITADPFGGLVPVTVSAPSGCAWAGIPGSLPAAFQVQSPAQGVGSGSAYVNIEPNTGSARSDTLTIANTAVTVNQGAAAAVSRTLGDQENFPATLTAPGIAQISSATLTSSAGDPTHSCTGSTDFKTGWWTVTPTTSGALQILASARRTDVTGNSGIVLTAYAGSGAATELGCATVPQDTSSEIDAVIRFSVSAGTVYLVEVSALGAGSTFSGTVTVAATMSASPEVTVSVTPASANATAGGGAAPFTAQVANAANTAVRWSISPQLGAISPAGIYTPPATLAATAKVTVTATTFSPPFKQATATVNVVPPSGGGYTPTITSGGIVSASAFGGFAAATPGSWIEIYGSNLGPSSGYTWQGSDFIGNNAPTALQGVSLKINGAPAFLDYVSATQVNAQVPAGVGTGPATVILTNSNGESEAFPLMLNALEPGLLAPSSFTVGGKQYVVAFNSDGSYTLPTASTLGLNSRPAKPGETVVIYGVGFGPVAASGGTPISPGIVVTQANQLTNSMQMALGGTRATLTYEGLAPNFVGLYQFNVVVPPSLASSDTVPLTFNVGGNTGSQTLYTAVHN